MANINSSLCPELVQRFKDVYPLKQWAAEGFFEENDLLDVDCHWLKFDPPRPSVNFFLAIIYVIIFVVGFVSNSFTIYVIGSSKKLVITPANILQTNLAISNLVLVLMIPVFIFNSLHQGPAIGKLGCSVYGFLVGLSGTCSGMSLAAIAVERFLVISRPLNLGRKPTRRWAYFMSISTWLYSAAFAALPFFGVGKYVPEGYLTSCTFNYLSHDWSTKIFILAFFIGAWVVPLSIIVYSYTSIVKAVAQSRVAVAQTSSGSASTETTFNQPMLEFKVSKMVISLIGAWMLAWTPYAIVTLIGISGHGYRLTPLSATLPALFAKLGTCVDPFIYTLNQPKIQTEISLRLHTLLSPDNNRPSPSCQAVHHNNRRTTMGSQQHHSKAVICRPISNSHVKRSGVPSSLIANENNATFNNETITYGVSNNALYGTSSCKEHRRQYYASRLCERRTKSAPTSPILERNITKTDHTKMGLLVSIPDLLLGENTTNDKSRPLPEAITRSSSRHNHHSTVAIDVNVIDSNKLGFTICLSVNCEESKPSKEMLD